MDRDFVPSQIDPCLYLKDGMAMLTYVDDCIIVGKSTKTIGALIHSLQNGQEGFNLTDEGNIDKFLGVEITNRANGEFEMSQPHLISRIVAFLGLEVLGEKVKHRDRVPASSVILDKDLDGKPRKKSWKYRTAVGMLSYLQANTRPDIAMATHQTARFTIAPKLSHEQAVDRIGKYLRCTLD